MSYSALPTQTRSINLQWPHQNGIHVTRYKNLRRIRDFAGYNLHDSKVWNVRHRDFHTSQFCYFSKSNIKIFDIGCKLYLDISTFFSIAIYWQVIFTHWVYIQQAAGPHNIHITHDNKPLGLWLWCQERISLSTWDGDHEGSVDVDVDITNNTNIYWGLCDDL